ncbi:apolipoprotein N-acyltransferase [Leptospira congkakensis]|uniref:Apolipoprotein N-acyltransferase n=1 Tax=Leptospira congkakensis TaxID=2484932 RepID=A0A4Z1A262_9LEPT|nr:apolipoprotein N-acyltransferase [Leptospira congkakensis]TGL87770.1 apolipoprotein N-acyltransferase [Leptospira congkakensis]TGL89614.1 apolipoprotein N-acyltransferase [Leptospira congkakensis]TGL95920.1 apolipoprotein N-acyltransferase [Leptospira congkakensis]
MRKHSKIPQIKYPLLLLFPVAILFALALEPFGFASAGFLCIFLLLYFTKQLTLKASWKQTIYATFLFSFLVTLTSFHWIWTAIRNISGQGFFVSIILFLIYALVSFYKVGIVFFGSLFLTKQKTIKDSHFFLFVLPSLFLISDWICPMVFPVYWGDLFRNNIFWRQMARFGTEVLGFVSIFSAALLYLMLLKSDRGIRHYFSYLIPIFCFFLLNLYFLAETIPQGPTIHLALIQPNTPYAKREIQEDQVWMTRTIQSVYDIGLEAIRNASKPIDLLVLPESAIPFLGTIDSKDPHSTYSKSFVDVTTSLVRTSNTPLVFNELVWEEGSRNSLTVLHQVSLVSERRYKQILLPFGEYLPGENQIPWLRKIFPESSNHIPGKLTEALTFQTKIGETVTFSPLICYEVLYPDLVRAVVKHSPSEFILNLTNDSWFESQTETKQHAGAGRLRSIESGRPVVRVAVTGITTAFDPWGREIMGELQTFQKAIGYLDLPTVEKDRTTPYIQFGPGPWRFMAVLLLFLVFFRKSTSDSTIK